jgi:hypothetical protein
MDGVPMSLRDLLARYLRNKANVRLGKELDGLFVVRPRMGPVWVQVGHLGCG